MILTHVFENYYVELILPCFVLPLWTYLLVLIAPLELGLGFVALGALVSVICLLTAYFLARVVAG